jgi:hypothetical protein
MEDREALVGQMEKSTERPPSNRSSPLTRMERMRTRLCELAHDCGMAGLASLGQPQQHTNHSPGLPVQDAACSAGNATPAALLLLLDPTLTWSQARSQSCSEVHGAPLLPAGNQHSSSGARTGAKRPMASSCMQSCSRKDSGSGFHDTGCGGSSNGQHPAGAGGSSAAEQAASSRAGGSAGCRSGIAFDEPSPAVAISNAHAWLEKRDMHSAHECDIAQFGAGAAAARVSALRAEVGALTRQRAAAEAALENLYCTPGFGAHDRNAAAAASSCETSQWLWGATGSDARVLEARPAGNYSGNDEEVTT